MKTANVLYTEALKNSRPIRNWRDLILFYEYFHGDNGAGLVPVTRQAGAE